MRTLSIFAKVLLTNKGQLEMAMGRIARLMAAVFAAGLIYTPAAAQQIFVYPTKCLSTKFLIRKNRL
jgi:hypothetical protein